MEIIFTILLWIIGTIFCLGILGALIVVFMPFVATFLSLAIMFVMLIIGGILMVCEAIADIFKK